MTYQPKHLAPSLDYQAWLKEQEALPLEWNEPVTLTNNGDEPILAAGHGSDAKVLQPGDTMTLTWPVRTYEQQLHDRYGISPEPSRAGHEWDSRSWFA